MTFSLPRLVALRLAVATFCVAATLVWVQQEASAQTYYYPANNYGWNYVSQPSAQYYWTPSTSSYRSTPRPTTGYGSNLHRNFTIRQEQLRSQRTGLPPRNRGNIRWAR